MAVAEIEQRVAELAEALVLADVSDLQTLADIHSRIEDVGKWAEEAGCAEVAAACEKAAALVEKVVLGEAPEGTMDVVGQFASALQAIVCQGRSLDEVKFPPELGLDSKEAESTPVSSRSGDVKSPAPEVLEEAVEIAGSGRSDSTEAAPAEQAAEAGPVPFEGDTSLLADFITESVEHLEAADVHLLTLEDDSHNEEALNAVFRAFHTIKGVAGFLGLGEIQELAHQTETLLDRARKGRLELAGGTIDVVFEAADAMKRLVEGLRETVSSGLLAPRDPAVAALLGRIQAVAEGRPGVPGAEAFGVEPEQKLGEILVETGSAHPQAVEDALRKQRQPPEPKKLGEVMVELGMTSSRKVERALGEQVRDPDRPKLGEVMVQKGEVGPEELAEALHKQQQSPTRPKLGEILVREGETPAREVAKAVRGQKLASGQGAARIKEAVRVDAERLDRLVDTIGELVIAESMVSQSVALMEAASPELASRLSQFDKITRELQEMATSLRMVPIRGTFQKMARLVRDLAKKAGKRIAFEMSGEDTELDKAVVDKIGDPLVHLVRNAVDHGVEASAEERRAAGKPEVGRIALRAFHKGGNIYIEVSDDGRGLDRGAILAKARERGLISDGDSLSDREVFELIFQPGFSTAGVVTDVSGRGVGMDVVRKSIEALRGQVEIHSEPGKGTTFSLRLPLTLAIIDGMVVRVGAERYIVPTLSVVTSLRPEKGSISTVLGRGEMLRLQGELVPVCRLAELFEIPEAAGDLSEAIAVVVEDEGAKLALVADELLGQQQIVIKSLGEGLRGIPGIAGGAIMPDGRVGLILDVGGLVRLTRTTEGEGHGGSTRTGPRPSSTTGSGTLIGGSADG